MTLRALAIVAYVLCVPLVAEAQQATAFDPVASGLRVGNDIIVLADGPSPGSPEAIKGRVTELTSSSLVLDDGRQRERFATSQIQYVTRLGDPVWDGFGKGALTGLLAGIGVQLIAFLGDGCQDRCIIGPADKIGKSLAVTAGIGAVVGAALDGRTKAERLIWQRPLSHSETSVVPHARRGGARVQFTLRF